MIRQARLVVAGGGPAGIMAAVEGSRRGLAVTLVDENASMGGQFFRGRQASTSPGSPRYLAASAPDVQTLAGTLICDAPADGRLAVWSESRGVEEIPYDFLVIATGAYDRTVAIPGWTLPGVLTAGASHTLAKVHGLTLGRRAVVAGAGPFLLPVADVLAAHGSRVTVVEATRFRSSLSGLIELAGDPAVLMQAAGYTVRLTARRASRRYGRMVTAIHGRDRVEGVTIHRVDSIWRPIAGSQVTLEADTVSIGFGFVPQLDLAQLVGCDIRYRADSSDFAVVTDRGMRTSRRHTYAAGEVTGVGGVRVGVVEGQIAGLSAAFDAGLVETAQYASSLRDLCRRLRPRARIAEWIRTTYRPRQGLWGLAQPSTVMCRCEDVTIAGAAAVLEVTAATPIALKTATRAGMGLCMGHICGPYITEFLRAHYGFEVPSGTRPWSLRPPIRPVPLGAWPQRLTGEEP